MTPSTESQPATRFSLFSHAVTKRFKELAKLNLYRTKTTKEELWNTYLNSFPEGLNPLFKTRTEHDCNCCKSFIRAAGGVVAIQDRKILTIWDISIGGLFQVVADAMAELVRTNAIDNVFLHGETKVGIAQTHVVVPEGVRTWDHFFANIPASSYDRDPGPKLSNASSTKDVMLRSLKEITLDAVDTVLDLISQGSLYRGEEHKFALDSFKALKINFDKLDSPSLQDLYCWENHKRIPASVSRIHSTVIGTLLTDLSEGSDLERSVKSFESKVAPTNYKRPTALVTKAMIERACITLDELGLTSALERRYATIDDITINNIVFADRQTRKEMNVFDTIATQVQDNPKNYSKVEEISIDDFLTNVVPRCETIEILFENRHTGSLVSLVAPSDPTAKNLFKWDNNFSWSYTGDLTDSIKERVKRAGGKVDGDFRASLSWYNFDDLDLHLREPKGNEIYYANKHSSTCGELDVDMNVSPTTRTAVENIVFPQRRKMQEGIYKLFVNNFNQREKKDVGFEVELEFNGVVQTFSYNSELRNKGDITVCEFNYTHANGIEILNSLPSTQATKTVWGLPTQVFQKVNVIMLSPNHWDDRAVGNKHYFFMMDKCLNDGQARGFFNEYLNEALNTHRKVFEIVGSKMKTSEADRQLSGLGFSSTQRNSVLCRVTGNVSRTLKVTF